ncbi:hypothetical protein ET495_04230 [Xylanimonas allomyrinae]|uniref:Uncharacterized protein n=1 Tax=Xylanimonas allomyrinae TaxID=2509459 RepID=A0A4P6EMS3_9MICO|nr:hypothetical protein ET495_04230 [Xylanimonas allomyrinae]
MVVPLGSAERRSRTTYRPTMPPRGSTQIVLLTGTTSSFTCTALRMLAALAAPRSTIFGGSPRVPVGRARAAATIRGQVPAGRATRSAPGPAGPGNRHQDHRVHARPAG